MPELSYEEVFGSKELSPAEVFGTGKSELSYADVFGAPAVAAPKQPDLPEGYTRVQIPPAELEALKNRVPDQLRADTRSDADRQASYRKWRDSQEFADQVRRLEEKQRKDYKLEVDAALLDKERRTDTLEKAVTAAPINIATGLQNIGEQVGGVAAGAAKLYEKFPYLPPSLLSIPAVQRLVKEQGDTVREEWGKLSAENRRDIEGLGQDEAGKALGRLVETAATSSVALPAAVIGGLPAAAGVAGAQSFGGTFNEAQAAYERKGDDKSTAESRALTPAILSGLATGLITAAGGKTGIEAIANLGSAQAVKALGAKNLKDIAGSVLKNFGMEAAEEATDQIAQSIIQVASYNPNLTFKDAVGQVMEAGVMGGILGGVVGGATSGVEAIRNRNQTGEPGKGLTVGNVQTGLEGPAFEISANTKGEPDATQQIAVEKVSRVEPANVELPAREAGESSVPEVARAGEAKKVSVNLPNGWTPQKYTPAVVSENGNVFVASNHFNAIENLSRAKEKLARRGFYTADGEVISLMEVAKREVEEKSARAGEAQAVAPAAKPAAYPTPASMPNTSPVSREIAATMTPEAIQSELATVREQVTAWPKPMPTAPLNEKMDSMARKTAAVNRIGFLTEAAQMQEAFKADGLTGAERQRASQPDVQQRGAEADPFYSRLTRTVEQSPQGKASGAQWKATIKNSKLGANVDEMGLVGVNDLEDGKTYTKQEVLDYLKANEVVVKDVTLGEHDLTRRLNQEETDYAGEDMFDVVDSTGRVRYTGGADDSAQYISDDLKSDRVPKPVHFSNYQLPGGKEGSYREVLLTVPGQTIKSKFKVIRFGDAVKIINERDGSTAWYGEKVSEEDVQRLKERYEQSVQPSPAKWQDGHSQYYSIANPVVRLRFNERTTADGKRMLFLEEVQAPQKGQFEKMPALFQKNWREIAFKWALRHAAENGFDSVGWTTGEQQAARYDLSKQVSEVRIDRYEDGSRYDIVVLKPDGEILHEEGPVDISRIESLVGKSLAEKAESIPKGGRNEFTGLDLKVGGEGLKKLYDSDFRNVVNGLPSVKKSGQKVGVEQIAVEPERAFNRDNSTTVTRGDVLRKVESIRSVWNFPGRTPEGWQNWNTALDAQAQKLLEEMGSGWSYEEAMQYYGSNMLADKLGFGGAFEKLPTQDSIHALTVTPAIRESVMGGQAMFSRGTPAATPISEAAARAAVKKVIGEVPPNVRFISDPTAPRGRVTLIPGERGIIVLNLARLGDANAVMDTLREELVHAAWNSTEVATARAEMEKLVTDADIEKQIREGYDPEVAPEEAANELVRNLFAKHSGNNIFKRAMNQVVLAVKRLFGINLNPREFAMWLMREAVKNRKVTAALFTPTEEQLAALKNAGNVVGQLASARRIFNELAANPDTERVVSEPTLRKVGKAIEGVDEMAANYPTLQADPSVPKQIKSRATNDAAHQIRTLEDSVARSDARFAGKDGLVEEKKKLSEKLDKVLDKKALASAFLAEFKRAGKQAYRDLRNATRAAVRDNVAGTQRQVGIQQEIAEGEVAHAAFRAALGKSAAVAKVYDFLSRMDIDPTQFKNTPELLGAIKSKAMNFPDSTLEQVVGADTDTINTVARVIMRSEPLRQRVAELKEIEGASNQFRELQRQLRETLKAGDVGKVINQMLKGVGKNAADKALSAKAAKLLLAQEKRLADSIMVLEKSNEAIKAIINSPEYKAMKAQVYADAGIRDIIATTTGFEVRLEPVIPGDPVVSIPVDTAVSSSREALEMAADYKAKALAYLADPESPNYNPKHAAGLRHFLDNQFDAIFNPGIMPDAGRMLPSALSSLTRALFSWVGNPELVPMWIKQYGAGLVFNRVAATENASSTGLQAVRGIFDEYQPRLQRATRAAMKAHGIRDAADYKEDVLVLILASRQDFATTPLKAGDDLKNGYTVKGTDLAYISEMLAFEQAVIKKLTATTGQAYSSIAADPVGILFKDAKGRPVYRLPLDSGPSTTGRTLSSAYQFAKDWASSSPARRIRLLDGSERVLRGYVKDATNPAFKWNYGYREALVEVWEEMSSANRLESFEDLVERVSEKVEDEPEVVASKLMAELDALFNRLVKEQDEVRARKELADSQGGTSQFNTERGNMVVPSEWYDYGMVTTGDYFNFQMQATEPLAIAHLNAVRAAVQFLNGKVDKLDAANLKEEDVFTLAQAKDSLTKLDAYHDQLKRAMDPKVMSRNAADLEYPGLARSIFDFGIASLLGKPVVGAANIIGGGWALWRYHMAVRQQSFLRAGAEAAAQMTQQIYRMGVASLQSSRNPVTKRFGNAVAAARNAPVVGALARHLARQNEVHRELYSQSVEDGIIRQRDAASSVGSLLDMVERARSIQPRAPRSVGRKVASKLTTSLRLGSRAITRYTIQTGDDLLNTVSHQEAMNFRKDFENRAMKFGEVREARAAARGADPTDVTKPENRFTDQEMVDGPLFNRRLDTKAAALDTRTFVRDRVGADLDAKMWDFYRRRKAAKAREAAEGTPEGTYTADERLFNEQEMRQLRLAIAERFNLASRSSRPIGTHTGVLQKNMGVLLGYTGFALEEFLQATARLNTRGALRGYGWTLPVIIGMLLSAALVGALLLQPARQELRELWNNSASQVPTIYNAQTDAQQRDAWISGAAALIPLYGSAVALLTDNASNKGYNLDSQFVAINLASDLMRTTRASWEMGDATVPAIRFAERNVFPATFLAQFMPQYSGLKETAKDRAELVLAAKGSGLEAMVRVPGRGEPRYTELSPLLNEFSNSIGNRDQAGAMAAFNAIVQMKTQEGVADPRKEAIRAVRSRNPLGVFVQQPTEQQVQQVLASMPAEKAARVRDTLAFFGGVMGRVGGSQPVRAAGGGGGFSFGRAVGRTRRGGSRRGGRTRVRAGRTRRQPRIRRGRRR